MSVTLSYEEQLIADLGERRDQAFRNWRDLVSARAMTPEGAAALSGRR